MSTSILQRLRVRDDQLFLSATLVIGVLAGLSAVLFTLSIERLAHWLFGMSPSASRMLLVPSVVGLITGVLLAKFFPDVRGSGVPQTDAAYHLAHGNIPFRVAIGKFITGVLCVGSGHSMGREGPSVQIGASIASSIGRWLNLSPERVRALVPIGGAAALSAAFNTPVAAVLFALEEIIGDLNAGIIGPTVIASVASVIVERSILGNQPLFRVPQYHLVNPAELLAYAVLGVVGGIISLIFCKGLLWARSLFMKLPRASVIVHPAIGGLIIGAVLLAFPQVMGVGYEYVDQALNGGLAIKMMAVLCAAKLVATIISYSSGNAGGIFAPSLYLGAMAGGAVGGLVHHFAPVSTGDPGAYALVGMGVLFAGIIRAPMTSVFMIFELTQDYQILVPLMVANLLSFMISKHYQPKPIYHALLEQDRIFLPGPESRLPSGSFRVQDVMTREIVLISPETLIDSVWLQISKNGKGPLVVTSSESLVGILTRSQVEKAIKEGKGQEPVSALGIKTDCLHVYADQPVDLALERLAKSGGAMPVLSRHGHRVIGAVTKETLLNFLDQSSNGRS